MTGPDSRVARACQFLDARDYPAAIEFCSRFISEEPASADAYFLRAQAHKGANDPEAALADAGRAIELEPEDPAMYFLRGRWLIAWGHYAAGIEDLVSVVALESASGSTRHLSVAKMTMAVASYLLQDFASSLASIEGLDDDLVVYADRRRWTPASLRAEIAKQRPR
jgi:tetratricopeptide (TPR) repeat protein